MKITFETLKIIFITGKFWFSRVISFQNILRIGCFQVFASTWKVYEVFNKNYVSLSSSL